MITVRSPDPIYSVLEKCLSEAAEPLSAVDLFDDPQVRQYAEDADAVSNALGYLWRRGYVSRFPARAEENSRARFAYKWKSEAERTLVTEPAPHGTQRVVFEVNGVKITIIVEPK